jgi:hypothetical protein
MSNAFDFGTGNIAVALDVLFPSNVNPGPGVGIDKTGAVWTVSLDTPPLAENISPAPSSNYFVSIYDNEQGLYEKVRLDNLVAAATASLDVRTPIGDTNYTVLSSDRYVGLTAQLTVNRTLSLPPANTAAGRELTLQDEVGGLSGAHYWIIGTTGTDTINGHGSGMVLSTAYGGLKLRSNGSNAWNVILTTGATVLQDASYTANGNDHAIVMATLTVPRGVILPAAAQYAPGQRLLIVDQSGSCSSTNTITITPHAGDLINGVSSAVLQQAFDFRGLISDAVSKWTIVDTSQGAGGSGGPVHSTDIVDASPLGRALITQTTAAADRTSLGSGLTGDQLFLAASPGAARTTLGSGAVGDQVFTSATTGAAQTALGLASGATMPATSVGASPPATPLVGQQWWNSNDGQLYVWYNDGTSSQWVPASNFNVAGVYLPLTGGTVSGALTVTARASFTAPLSLGGAAIPPTAIPSTIVGPAITVMNASGTTPSLNLACNAYYDGTNWRYSGAGAGASFISVGNSASDGAVAFYIAPTGAANGIATSVLEMSVSNASGVQIPAPAGLTVTNNLTANANATIAGNLTAGSSSAFTVVAPNASLAGTLTMGAASNGISYSKFYPGNTVAFGWTGSALHAYVNATDIGAITVTSDRRLKSNLEISAFDALAAVNALPVYSCDYTPPVPGSPAQPWDCAIIADEVEQFIPTAYEPPATDDGLASVRQLSLIATLLKAVQQLSAKVEALEARQSGEV